MDSSQTKPSLWNWITRPQSFGYVTIRFWCASAVLTSPLLVLIYYIGVVH